MAFSEAHCPADARDRSRRASHRRGSSVTTRRDQEARPAPNLVDRNFVADAPNRLWVADIIYVPTVAGFLYFAVVRDAFSGPIVDWAMTNHLRSGLVLSALGDSRHATEVP